MNSSDPSRQNSCSTCGSWWRLPLLLALLLAGIVLARSRGIRDGERPATGLPPAANRDDATSETVSLAVDFGDGREQSLATVTWEQAMTIEDLLALAIQAPNGPAVATQGAGASAFLIGIDGRENEGAQGRNWTYWVNGERGDRSFAIYELRPGDRVLWKFAPQ